ncbi:MAG: TPM domain-containing protein, partial [Bacteroidia bacterium]
MNKLFLIVCLFGSLTTFAQVDRYKGIPDAPNPRRLVNNLSKEFPDFLSGSETEKLEQKLLDFNNQTSNQITIVIVDDLAGYPAWEYATNIGEKWG